MTPSEFMRTYETAGRRGLEFTLSLIDENAIYWFSDGTCHVGKDAIEKVLRSNFELIQGEVYRICDIVWVHQSSDCAACTYRFEWTGTIRGNPASGSGRGTSVLAKKGDSWLIVHEHLSKGQTTS